MATNRLKKFGRLKFTQPRKQNGSFSNGLDTRAAAEGAGRIMQHVSVEAERPSSREPEPVARSEIAVFGETSRTHLYCSEEGIGRFRLLWSIYTIPTNREIVFHSMGDICESTLDRRVYVLSKPWLRIHSVIDISRHMKQLCVDVMTCGEERLELDVAVRYHVANSVRYVRTPTSFEQFVLILHAEMRDTVSKMTREEVYREQECLKRKWAEGLAATYVLDAFGIQIDGIFIVNIRAGRQIEEALGNAARTKIQAEAEEIAARARAKARAAMLSAPAEVSRKFAEETGSSSLLALAILSARDALDQNHSGGKQ